jgi:hypothetical protein
MKEFGSGEARSNQRFKADDAPAAGMAVLPSRWYSAKWSYVGAIFLLLAIGAVWANIFGYLTVDSWNYLSLAQSIRLGRGCSVAGTYYAVFPCGYPLAIALTAPSLDMTAMAVSSKVTNLVLLLLAFYFLSKTFTNVLVPLLVIVNPFTLELYQYTWSENLLLSAFCASLFVISRIARPGSSRLQIVALACALIVGCSARYFFGLFCVAIFAATWIAYGRSTAIRALPAFVGAAIFFLAYQKFNVAMTGFVSGEPRPAAPESFLFLLFRFVRQLLREVVIWGVLLLPFLWSLTRGRRWAFAASPPADTDAQACWHLALCGVGYLLFSFSVRTLTQYDIYSPRLISYGLVFVMAALVGMLTLAKKNCYPAVPVLIYGAFCLLAAQAEVVTLLASTIVHHRYVSPVDAVKRYRNEGTDADLIVELRPPTIAPTVDGYDGLYYPKHGNIVQMKTAPYSKPDSVDDLRTRVSKAHARSCVIDFTPYKTWQDIQRFVDETFPVGFTIRSGALFPTVVEQQRLDPTMRAFLLATFRPGQYVSCPF